jgi:hypothetical protein
MGNSGSDIDGGVVKMVSDEDRALIAPCGIYCGACPLYLARTDESLRRRIGETRGIAGEDVDTCEGCRPMRGLVTVMENAVCETYACAVDGRGVEFCHQCQDFPCLRLAPCADRAQEIPHNTKVYNLILLRKEGVDSFIQNYRTRIRHYLRGKKPRAGGDIQF